MKLNLKDNNSTQLRLASEIFNWNSKV